ncbi:hypothetical protein [Microbacterium testaceum]|uniref:hypothetical protein n=1 Tax=Microbacterium testaceum TaxID=2033 RepID=UPI000CCE37ED|nr:hypothetical protein [Microbacterium testaceum]PNW09164.1 hypothetical protein C1632_08765 [Microbacterium testaceum]WJS90786.1 hypothetical protein NYQ11_15960 [Microbacterium testaceum]
MTLSALRDDALRGVDGATRLRLSLPWIRSLPLSSLLDPIVQLDGREFEPAIILGERRLSPDALPEEDGWWYLQDRVVLEIPDAVSPGIHQVSVSFRLEIPYLPGGPDAPLRLPFAFTRTLDTDAVAAGVARAVGGTT